MYVLERVTLGSYMAIPIISLCLAYDIICDLPLELAYESHRKSFLLYFVSIPPCLSKSILSSVINYFISYEWFKKSLVFYKNQIYHQMNTFLSQLKALIMGSMF